MQQVRSTVDGRNGTEPHHSCSSPKLLSLPPLSSPTPSCCASGSASAKVAPQHPKPSAQHPKPREPGCGLPAALHSPPRSPGSYHDFLVQRDSLMKWQRRRRSRLKGPS